MDVEDAGDVAAVGCGGDLAGGEVPSSLVVRGHKSSASHHVLQMSKIYSSA